MTDTIIVTDIPDIDDAVKALSKVGVHWTDRCSKDIDSTLSWKNMMQDDDNNSNKPASDKIILCYDSNKNKTYFWFFTEAIFTTDVVISEAKQIKWQEAPRLILQWKLAL